MRVGLVYLRPRQVGFIRVVGPYGTASLEAWRRMNDWLERQRLRGGITHAYGLSHDDPRVTKPQACRYDACVELPSHYAGLRTDGIGFQTLPGGAFARARHAGEYDGVRPTLLEVRDVWLPAQAGIVFDRRRPLMVVYLENGTGGERLHLRCDVCLPIRSGADDALRLVEPSVAA